MIRIFISLSTVFLFLSGCFSDSLIEEVKQNRLELGEVSINYYSDKSVTSLEIPPDLTSPSYDNSFRLSEIAGKVDENIVNLTNNEIKDNETTKIASKPVDIDVLKSGPRRWLRVNKEPEVVWNLSKQFLKNNGFSLKKINKNIGVMETDYLENKPRIPDRNLGFMRSFLATQVDGISYTLPTVDSYKIRIEPVDDNRTDVFLSLTSMAEVVDNNGNQESTIWQFKEKDYLLENQMLLSLMQYLGGESAKSREKILNAKENGKIFANVENGINGYAKLVFKLNLNDAWDNMSWALSEANISLEDKDIKERSFYILAARDSDKGIFGNLFGDEPIRKSYHIRLKQIQNEITEAYFYDISELNEKETKEFSFKFFEKIAKLF